MKILNWRRRFSRRWFLKGSAATAAVVAATRGGALAQEFRHPEPGKLTPEQMRTLVVFTRDLFPHDRLDDSYYQRAVKPLQEEAAKNGDAWQTLVSGIDWLNAAAKRMAGSSFAEITEERKRVEIVTRLRGDQSAPPGFLDKVYNSTIVSLYNQPELWPKFGYEGPSSAKGGYLHRGFNDIDWL